MRGRGFIAASLLLLSVGRAWGADPFPGIDPSWVLLHEPAVLEELKLSAAERQAFTKLMDELDPQVFALRNKPQDVLLPELPKIFDRGKQGLKPILRPAQHQRLSEILLRRLGTQALLRDEVAAKMQYDAAQRSQIESIIAETQSAVAALEKELGEGKPRGPLEKRFVELKTDEQQRILKLLKPQQQSAWRKLIGPIFDLSRLGRPAFKAPELVDTGEWINSKPLRLDQLRGKVAIVHFYACGCINCIRNYPWYNEWHEAFHDKGAVVIGIHTPETPSERDLNHVRRKAAEEKFAFPILLDANSENWNAWGNSMWPSVYLIDKRGYLRHFWPGELNWQGNQGEKYMRQRIEELLAERES